MTFSKSESVPSETVKRGVYTPTTDGVQVKVLLEKVESLGRDVLV